MSEASVKDLRIEPVDTSDDEILKAGLEYADNGKGLKIFFVHGIAGEHCTCGQPVALDKSGDKPRAGKHPITESYSYYPLNEKRTPSPILASSNDPDTLRKAYIKHYNIAMYAGANDLIETDFDGAEGVLEFRIQLSAHPEWFDTWIDETGLIPGTELRGIHVFHRQPGENKLSAFNTKFGEVRIGNQYVVISPSIHYSGVPYRPLKEHSYKEKGIREIPLGYVEYLKSIDVKEKKRGTEKNSEPITRAPSAEIDEIIKKYGIREDIAAKIKAVNVGDADRSKMLYHIAMYLVSKDMLETDALKILKYTVYNKFRDRGDKEDYWLKVTWNAVKDEYTEQDIKKNIKSTIPPQEPAPGQDLNKEYLDNDIGNGDRFADHHHDKILWMGEKESWYYRKDGIWHEDLTSRAVELAKQTALSIDNEVLLVDDENDRDKKREHAAYSQNMAGLNNMLKSARGILGHEITEFDNDPWMLPCLNQVVNLKTGEARPYLHTDMFTKFCPIIYDKNEPIPEEWLNFIKDISRKDDIERLELEAYHKRIGGYIITGDTGEQCMFIYEGGGNNGKTTYINLLALLFGMQDGYVKTIGSDIIMARKYDGHPEELARLKGARIVITSETKKGRRLNIERVKAIAGSDYIDGAFKYGHYFTYKPELKLILATNNAPIIDEDSEGIWRKIRKIPFDHVVPKEKRVKNFENILVGKAPGILNWFIEGCIEWQQKGLSEPECVLEATMKYREDMDSLKQFVNERCEININNTCAWKETNKKIYAEYVDYCEQLGIYCVPKRDMLKKLITEYKLEKCDIRFGDKHDKGLKYIKIKELLENDEQRPQSTNPPNPPKVDELKIFREEKKIAGNIVDTVDKWTNSYSHQSICNDKSLQIVKDDDMAERRKNLMEIIIKQSAMIEHKASPLPAIIDAMKNKGYTEARIENDIRALKEIGEIIEHPKHPGFYMKT